MVDKLFLKHITCRLRCCAMLLSLCIIIACVGVCTGDECRCHGMRRIEI